MRLLVCSLAVSDANAGAFSSGWPGVSSGGREGMDGWTMAPSELVSGFGRLRFANVGEVSPGSMDSSLVASWSARLALVVELWIMVETSPEGEESGAESSSAYLSVCQSWLSR